MNGSAKASYNVVLPNHDSNHRVSTLGVCAWELQSLDDSSNREIWLHEIARQGSK
jgi:hypothetical protein